MTEAVVVLATHQPEPDLLRRQIDSIVAQTQPDWRMLIHDDASDPTLRALVADLAAADERIALLEPRGHLGHYRTFEYLLDQARPYGLPVFTADQDDWWHPEKMARMLPPLHAGASGVFSAMRVVDEDARQVRPRFLSQRPQGRALSPAGLLMMNCVSGAALAVAAGTLAEALPLPSPRHRGWHDQWLAAVAARLGDLVYLDQPLVDYTRHSTQVVGDGLRHVDTHLLRTYLARTGNPRRVVEDMVSRARWVQSAAARLQRIGDSPDESLAVLSEGGATRALRRQLRTAVADGDVPRSRAALLYAGYLLTGAPSDEH